MARGVAFATGRSLALATLLLTTSCVDVTHDDAVDALGGETPGGPSALHRPGQPCGLCHGPEGPADSEFRLSGTVYLLRSAEDPAPGALVQIQDQTGFVFTVPTNAAGNFWIPDGAWDPVYPVQARVNYQGLIKQMSIAINRATSCADCHVADIPSRTSPGRVYMATNRGQLPKGTTP